MSTLALYASLFGGGSLAVAALAFALYWSIRKDAADAAVKKIDADNAAKAQRQNDVLQKEVTNADLDKSLRDGTF